MSKFVFACEEVCGDHFRQVEKDISLSISAPNGFLPKSLVLKGENVTDVNLRLASRNNMKYFVPN